MTTTHRVLTIPELLRNIIFSFKKLSNTYHAALVCRTGSEIALDALWYEVDDLCTLFNLLVPLTDLTADSETTRFARLQDLRKLDLPRFWLTSHMYKVLGQLPCLAHLDFKFDYGEHGNPLDTLTFNPISGSEEMAPHNQLFPSLTEFGQSAPILEMSRFISSWQGSSRLRDLTISSQILELPDTFRSALDIIAVHCPKLTFLGIAGLMTSYRHLPRGASQARITLDTLRPLHGLKHLDSLEISHALPFALTNEDFLILIKEWSHMKYLSFGCDPYPLDIDVVHTAQSPLPTPETTNGLPLTTYPIMGLLHSVKALRKHCPRLEELYLFGIDDFVLEEGKTELADDELTALPFPELKWFSFGTSLITSDTTIVAKVLNRYLAPNASFLNQRIRGGDEDSPYLTYLNLKPLLPLRDELPPGLQTLIDGAEPNPPNLEWAGPSQNIPVDEPVGVRGVLGAEETSEVDRRMKYAEDIVSLARVFSEVRQEERERARRRCISCRDLA
ncbi:hypothetical protein BDN72DRAFT_965825, partial [Pluteus cervinus]